MGAALLTHRQRILGDDDSYIVDDEAVPHEQARTGGFDHQPSAVQQEEKAGQEIAQPEHADPRGARHEHDGQHEPEQVAERQDLHHVQVRSERWKGRQRECIFSSDHL